jgi:hypothetical protein
MKKVLHFRKIRQVWIFDEIIDEMKKIINRKEKSKYYGYFATLSR